MRNHLLRITYIMSGKNKFALFWQILFVASLFAACTPPKGNSAKSDHIAKIKFDLEQLDENGLLGPPDGKRALSYEFCIPLKEEYAAEVQSIDSTVTILQHASGRIGCSDNEYLCLGNTHQKNYQEVLFKLSRLEYVKKIEESFFEQ